VLDFQQGELLTSRVGKPVPGVGGMSIDSPIASECNSPSSSTSAVPPHHEPLLGAVIVTLQA
jgi:hypothetical protein